MRGVLQAEKYLRASSLRWTIVRPGGLSSDPPSKVGNVITGKEDTFLGLDGDPGREVSRTSVRTALAFPCCIPCCAASQSAAGATALLLCMCSAHEHRSAGTSAAVVRKDA